MAILTDIDKRGSPIGEFDLYDYGLPTTKAYLYHEITNGGNEGGKYPKNREYLRIIGFTEDYQIIQYGYVYFMLYEDDEGLRLSQYIGSNVDKKYRNKGLGDLLMSIYLYYSYDNGFKYIESSTRQRKLDILSLMQKYGFRVKKPEYYDNGEKIVLVRNKMVVDIFKGNRGGLYYRFKTKKAENIYKQRNAKVAGGYKYIKPQDITPTPEGYYKLGWVVPNEEYTIINNATNLITGNLNKSGFSR